MHCRVIVFCWKPLEVLSSGLQPSCFSEALDPPPKSRVDQAPGLRVENVWKLSKNGMKWMDFSSKAFDLLCSPCLDVGSLTMFSIIFNIYSIRWFFDHEFWCLRFGTSTQAVTTLRATGAVEEGAFLLQRVWLVFLVWPIGSVIRSHSDTTRSPWQK